jgi:hypothetical protein
MAIITDGSITTLRRLNADAGQRFMFDANEISRHDSLAPNERKVFRSRSSILIRLRARRHVDATVALHLLKHLPMKRFDVFGLKLEALSFNYPLYITCPVSVRK